MSRQLHPENPQVYLSVAGWWVCSICEDEGAKSRNGKVKGRFVHSTANARIREHAKEHGAVSPSPTPRPNSASPQARTPQKTQLQFYVGSDANGQPVPLLSGQSINICNALVAFCAENVLPLRILHTPSARKLIEMLLGASATTRLPGKDVLKKTLLEGAKTQRSEVLSALRGTHVVLLADGGTLLRKKLINFSLASTKLDATNTTTIYFWESVPVDKEGATAVKLKEMVTNIVEELKPHNITVLGMCTDNASNFVACARGFGDREAGRVQVRLVTRLAEDEEEEDEEEDVVVEEEEEKEDDDDETIDMVPVEESYAQEIDALFTRVSSVVQASNRYWVHIRCWAHTFQLVINDVFKIEEVSKLWEKAKSIINVFTPVKRLCLEAEMKAADEMPLSIITGCETRWNAKLEALYRLYEIGNFLEPHVDMSKEDLKKFTTKCELVYALLWPLATATNKVQADKMTLISAIPILTKTIATYENLAHREWKTHPQLTKSILTTVLKSLAHRKAQCFDNMASKHLEYLTPPFDFSCERTKAEFAREVGYLYPEVSDFVPRLFKEMNELIIRQSSASTEYAHVLPRDIQNETVSAIINARFNIEGFDKFWGDAAGYIMYLPRYVDILRNLAVTEAHIERMFSVQGRLMAPLRNRMSIQTVNAFMSWSDESRRKARRVEMQTPLPAPILSSLSDADWVKLIAYLIADISLRSNQKVRTRKEHKLDFKIGTHLKVLRGGEFKFAVVVAITSQDPLLCTVYFPEEKAAAEFDQKTTQWQLIKS